MNNAIRVRKGGNIGIKSIVGEKRVSIVSEESIYLSVVFAGIFGMVLGFILGKI